MNLKNMNKKIILFLVSTLFLSFFYIPVLAEETATSTSSLQELIQLLERQIEELRAQIATMLEQIESLRKIRQETKEEVKEIKVTLKLIRQLRKEMSGEDVELLQEILATDPEIYPEGLVTGYFGPLTEKAVKRFQKIAGIEQVGIVGPKTLSKINELLEEGAGSSGKVPPGLLVAPGIRKKLGFEPQPLPGQELPPGISEKITPSTTTPDTTVPTISELKATSTTATSTKISWMTDEGADSKVWYSTSTPLVIATSTPVVSSSDMVLNHEFTLSDLTASTTYYYLVSSTDDSGNTATGTEQSFTTLSE